MFCVCVPVEDTSALWLCGDISRYTTSSVYQVLALAIDATPSYATLITVCSGKEKVYGGNGRYLVLHLFAQQFRTSVNTIQSASRIGYGGEIHSSLEQITSSSWFHVDTTSGGRYIFALMWQRERWVLLHMWRRDFVPTEFRGEHVTKRCSGDVSC